MKNSYLVIFIIFFTYSFGFSQFPAHVKEIDIKSNSIVSVIGDLSQGISMEELSWAWKSSVACFPATQKEKFTGNHVMYWTQLPPHSIINITLEPDDKNADFSLYAYSIGTTNFSVVPQLSSCVSCEADHKWDYPIKNKSQDHKRSVQLNAINNPYNVIIGVVGAKGLNNGGYTLNIELQGGEKNEDIVQEKIIVIPVKCEKGKVTVVKGNLSQGVKIHDLSWAWKSSVACFPETQKTKFTGNHVIYVTEVPKQSEMEITVIPEDKNDNFSLYAYEIGVNNTSIVPELASCIRCEVDHKWDYPKKGKTQDHTRTVNDIVAINNPYKVIIGVVGADGLKEGAYTLEIKFKSR